MSARTPEPALQQRKVFTHTAAAARNTQPRDVYTRPTGAKALVCSGDSGDVWSYYGIADDGHFHGPRRKPSEADKKRARRRKAIARASKRKNR